MSRVHKYEHFTLKSKLFEKPFYSTLDAALEYADVLDRRITPIDGVNVILNGYKVATVHKGSIQKFRARHKNPSTNSRIDTLVDKLAEQFVSNIFMVIATRAQQKFYWTGKAWDPRKDYARWHYSMKAAENSVKRAPKHDLDKIYTEKISS